MLPIAWIYVPRGKFPPEKPWTFLAKLNMYNEKGWTCVRCDTINFIAGFIAKVLRKTHSQSRSITYIQTEALYLVQLILPNQFYKTRTLTNLRCCQVFWSFSNINSYISVFWFTIDFLGDLQKTIRDTFSLKNLTWMI